MIWVKRSHPMRWLSPNGLPLASRRLPGSSDAPNLVTLDVSLARPQDVLLEAAVEEVADAVDGLCDLPQDGDHGPG